MCKKGSGSRTQHRYVVAGFISPCLECNWFYEACHKCQRQVSTHWMNVQMPFLRTHSFIPPAKRNLRASAQGESLGRLLLQEITEQLKKVAWELWELGQLNRQRDISADTTTSSFAVLNEEVAGRWVIPGVCPRQCLVVSVRVALLPSWGFSIHSWQASCSLDARVMVMVAPWAQSSKASEEEPDRARRTAS